MNILIILPGLSIEYNSITYTIIGLEKHGIKPIVVTSKSRGLKDPGTNSDFESHGATKIYRIANKSTEIWNSDGTKVEYKISEIIEKFSIRMLLVSTNGGYRISKHLSKKHNIPNILLLEFIFHKERFFGYSKKNYLGIKWLIPLAWKLHYEKFRNSHSSLVTFYNEEKEKAESTPNTFFVPWCNQITEKIKKYKHKRNDLIFAGEINEKTITKELMKQISLILKDNIIDKFHVIGYGNRISYIEDLKKTHNDKVIIHGSLPRNEVLEKISSSKYGIGPAILGGWGFMGECLALKTPLIILKSNKYKLRDTENAIIIEKFSDMYKQISHYNKNHKEYNKLQENGYLVYEQNYTGEKTAEYLAKAIKQTLNEFY